MAPTLLSRALQGITVTGLTTVGAFFVWTKHCHFTPAHEFTPATEPLFQGQWFKKFNPNANPSAHDECVRRIPLYKVRPELLEDAQRGGSKLVESFSQGIWGGFGYSIQRKIMEMKHRNKITTAHQLWTTPDLLASSYDQGTEITDHFVVLEKSPTAILIRCGDSPLVNPDTHRVSDGLFEISATADFDNGFAEFKLKSIFFQGEGDPRDTKPSLLLKAMGFLHPPYTKLWMESAIRRVVQ